MTQETNHLKQLFEIENDRRIFSFTFEYENFLMWAYVRFFFLQRCIENILNIPSPWQNAKKPSAFALARYFCLSYRNRPSSVRRHYPLIFFGTDISNVCRGDHFENRLIEYFARQFEEQTLVIERSDRRSFHRPKKRNTLYLDWFYIISRLRSLSSTVTAKDRQTIRDFISFLKVRTKPEFSPDAATWDALRRELYNAAKRLPYLARSFRLFLMRTAPRIIFVEDACGGSHLVVLIGVAKSLRIRVAEYQHGLLSRNHPSYNFAPSVRGSRYMDYLPDDFLYFGTYWESNSRIPARPVIIGYPFLQETLKSAAPEGNRNILLYISSGLDKNRYIQDILRLRERLATTSLQLVFRPHPAEFPSLESDYAALIRQGITINTGNVYGLLGRTKYLIGEISTMAFEALAFNITAFIIRSKASEYNIDSSYFTFIDDIEEIFDHLVKKNPGERLRDFWNPDWVQNYRRYVGPYVSSSRIIKRQGRSDPGQNP